MRIEQKCTHPRAQNASSGSGAGTPLFARPWVANSATGAFLTLSAIVIVGCCKVEAPKQPPLPVAWCESSAGCQRQTVAFYFYLSWPNGDSLAIVVPFFKSRPGDRDSRPAAPRPVRAIHPALRPPALPRPGSQLPSAREAVPVPRHRAKAPANSRKSPWFPSPRAPRRAASRRAGPWSPAQRT